MLVLGIETSCDETSVAVVERGINIISQIVSSSLDFHSKFGGIIPEAASRYHLESIIPILDVVFKKSKIEPKDLDLVAATYGPGLLGALMIGLNVAKTISFSLNIPLIPVNHILAHLYAPFLTKGFKPQFPAIGLVVSGGHTELFYIKEFNVLRLLGKTRDDACGEVFDKVAKILGLGFPGGPAIEEWAKKGNSRIKFKCASFKDSLDFSFSGIKTAVLYHVKKITANGTPLTVNEISDICASFQESIFSVLVEKARQACIMKKTRRLILGGGVTANSYLRERLNEMAKRERIEIFFPRRELCMDNAAMVAGLGYRLYKLDNIKTDYSLEPKPVIELGGENALR
ncbi:MAG: tRNA (adenosine(37)-N6)-threonylcarbamoyltransferase complex transferase subunit TsaD [Candidatus Omnitrophica bacterium]|nr:tRNA (adenosine(37)-N6)-threonylcarbamoyltransferase complex transferase subunit TsaD [Candidatus Omnitrophota bacterium]